MPVLTVIRGKMRTEIPFEGNPTVSQVLMQGQVPVNHPCGGHGVCKKCALKMEGALSPRGEAEKHLPEGVRLSCICELLGDACVWVDQDTMKAIEHDGIMQDVALNPMDGHVGAAVDVGTTTVAVRLLDLHTGEVLGVETMENPQRQIASDVIGRMESAMKNGGEVLRKTICDAVDQMVESLCKKAGVTACDVRVVTGNTTMLYLYTGKDPSCLSCAPFEADCLFDLQAENTYFPPCMSAFVGADITCAVLASGMTKKDHTALLVDVGTNGEIALWKNGQLLVSATAAGPAFEGGGIQMGCGSIPGAVDKVWAENGKIEYTTIGNGAPVGLCGSGIIDACAALLDTEMVDETGATDEDELTIAPGVFLTDRDIRAIQLAKGAIAAGIKTLMDEQHITAEEIDVMYLAGGFGSHLNLESAARIGLIPRELVKKTVVIGNAALSGAHMMLLNLSCQDEARKIASRARTVNLGGNPAFTENFMECMMFE